MRPKSILPGSLLALALVTAGCGADAGQGDGADTPGPGSDGTTNLEITIWPGGEAQGDSVTYTLRCDPPGGDHPNPVAACEALAELGAEAFAPVPAEAMCTQQYGGPMEAHVRGTIDGEDVDARLAYTDGCEISRWDRLLGVVPRPEGDLR